MAPGISSSRIAAAVLQWGIFTTGVLVLATSNQALGSPFPPTVDSTHGLIETDGTLDLSFNAGNFTNGNVAAAVLQSDGKLVIGGSFSQVHGVKRLDIARLNVDGTLDLSFDPGDAMASFEVEGITLQPDGKILVLAPFTQNGLTRLNSDGSLDNDFSPRHSIPGSVKSVVLQPDGKIIVIGGFSCIITAPNTCVARSCVARFNSDGSFDPTFDPGTGFWSAKGSPFTVSVVRQRIGANNGRILIQGRFDSFDGHSVYGIVRLNRDGSFDDTFTSGESIFWNSVSGISLQSDDQIVVFGSITGTARIGIVRLNSAGTLDSGFRTEAFEDYDSFGLISAVAQQPDGKLVVVGYFHSLGGEPANNVVRLETNGMRDVTFAATAAGASADSVKCVLVRPSDNKIFVGGYFSTYGAAPRGNVAWVNSDGSVDSTFTGLAGATDYFPLADAVAVQADGKLLVGGFFSSFDGSPHYNLVRLNPDGAIDPSFDATVGTDGSVRAFLIQSDGKIVVAGSFRALNGIACGRVVRLNSDGTLDPSFGPGVGATDTIYALAQDLAGDIYVGGTFQYFDGLFRPYIAKLNPAGAVDKTFNAGAAFLNTVFAIAPPDGAGRIVIGGGSGGIARLDGTTGARDLGFNQGHAFGGFDSIVRTVKFAPNGKYYVGGDFSNFNGTPRSHVARLNNDGSLDATFDGPTIDDFVFTLALQNGKVFVGTAGVLAPSEVIRLTNSGALDSSFATGTGFGITPLGTYSASSQAISALTVQPDGKLLVGGIFNQYNGTSRICLARLTGPSIPTPTPSILGNVSTRARVETGDNALIGGFIVFGTQPKRVIVRAIGSSLPIAGGLADPVLELRDATGALIASNDNWRSDQEAEIIATGIPPSSDLESAIVATLPAYGSAYTAILRGVNNGTGIGVVEAYDLDQTVDSKLANISTRGLVQTGDHVLIAGTIVLDEASQRVIVRALGPSLSVPGKLANPALELRDGNGALLRSNDNWRSDQEAEIVATGIPPSDDLESAIVETLPANGAVYTAIVRGVGETVGVAIVEIYSLN
jgi:uncharacterized delta-60 repeat protein